MTITASTGLATLEHGAAGFEQFRCGLHAGLAGNGRHPFALPGERPVWGRDRTIRVQHLKLEFNFDIPRQRVRGVTTTTFRPINDGLRVVEFDAIELDIDSVTDDRERPLDFTIGDGKLRIDLGRARSSRRPITTIVSYSCRPRRGLYFKGPEPAYPDRPTQIWTQGQAEDSPYYFPCLDFPGEKATSELFATVPDGWFVLSNGELCGAVEDKRRRRTTYHWEQKQPHPAYLITLVAGELSAVEEDEHEAGVSIEYYGPHGREDDVRRAFGRTPEMVSFFAEKIGVPYPWAKYATVAVADFIFGGMENTSATTMTDTLLHDERAHQDMADVCTSISAHELAHQWFGDLLTCREWSHGWLNESFATYFDALFTEHQRGWDAARYQLLNNAKLYHDEDSKQYRRPLVQNVFEEPIDIFDRHLYERGSLVLDMLRTNLGDELWWKAIHHYVTTHAGSDVLTHDFQRAIESATGRNLDWFFDQWVWKGGHPEFKATYKWDAEHGAVTIGLSQTQQTEDVLTSVYRTPLEIAFMTRRGLQSFHVEVSEAQHSFVFPLAVEPSFVAIDPGNRVLKTLDFEPGEAMLKAQLADDPQAMGRIVAAQGLAKLASPAAIDALGERLRLDDELDFVRAEIAAALGTIRAEAARDALVAAASAEPSRVRRAIATALGNFAEDATAARALTRFLQRGGDDSYYVQSAAAAALGMTRDGGAFATLRRTLGRPAHNDTITAGALLGMGQLRDERAVEVLLDYTNWGQHQAARFAAVQALGNLGPHLDDGARLRIRERLEELLDDPWLRVQLGAVQALAALKDVRATARLGQSAERALDGRVRRSARVAVRTLSEGADKGEDVRRLTDDLEKLRQENEKLRDRLVSVEARIDSAGDAGSSAGSGTAARSRRRGAKR